MPMYNGCVTATLCAGASLAKYATIPSGAAPVALRYSATPSRSTEVLPIRNSPAGTRTTPIDTPSPSGSDITRLSSEHPRSTEASEPIIICARQVRINLPFTHFPRYHFGVSGVPVTPHSSRAMFRVRGKFLAVEHPGKPGPDLGKLTGLSLIGRLARHSDSLWSAGAGPVSRRRQLPSADGDRPAGVCDATIPACPIGPMPQEYRAPAGRQGKAGRFPRAQPGRVQAGSLTFAGGDSRPPWSAAYSAALECSQSGGIRRTPKAAPDYRGGGERMAAPDSLAAWSGRIQSNLNRCHANGCNQKPGSATALRGRRWITWLIVDNLWLVCANVPRGTSLSKPPAELCAT